MSRRSNTPSTSRSAGSMRRAAAVDRDLAIHQQLFGRQEKSRRVAALVARRNMMSGSRGPDEFRAELDAKKQVRAATVVALNELRVEQEQQRDLSDDRLEAIAKDIESAMKSATLHVGRLLFEARAIFRYRRDEGGFAGWIEARLNLVRSTAYNMLNVYERFGAGQSVQILDTFNS